MLLAVLYLALCLGVGALGMNRKFGFWGYFFGSILLTPVIGLLLVLGSTPISGPRPSEELRAEGFIEEYYKLKPAERAVVRKAVLEDRP